MRRALLAAAWFLLAGPAAAEDDPFSRGMLAANARDFAEAWRLWRPLAEAGDPRSAFYLAMVLERGEGVARDELEAARYYRIAAAQGHAEAANTLAVLLIEGRGLPRDPIAAWAWFALAAERGSGFTAANRDRLGVRLTAEERAAAASRRDQLRGSP